MGENLKRKAVFAAVLLVIWISSGFGAPVFAQEVIDRIVAVVNDEIITLVQLNKNAAPFRQNIENSGKTGAEKDELIKSVNLEILNKMIDRSLTNQEAAKHNISVNDDDVDRAIENFKTLNNVDHDGLVKALQADGMSYEDYRKRIRTDILQSMLINRAVRSRVIVTEADIKAYYDAHTDRFQGQKKYHLRNILMDSEAGIMEAKKRLDAKASFIETAKTYSMAANAPDGGDLGVFDIGNFSDAIRDAVASLKAGQYSEVVLTGQGYQIIYVEKVLNEGGQSLEQVHDQIHDLLFREQGNKKFDSWVKALKESAHIKIML